MAEQSPPPSAGVGLLGWGVTIAVAALLISGAQDALDRELASRWPQVGLAVAFVAAHLVAFKPGIGGLARGVASILFLAAVVSVTQAQLGLDDSTRFAWSGVPANWLHHGLLLWGLGLGGAVLVIAPSGTGARLAIGVPVAVLLAPWVAGPIMGWSDSQILAGPSWLTLPWFLQPAAIALALLGSVALFALVLTAVGSERGGAAGPGARAVAWGLAVLLLGASAAVVRYQLTEPTPIEAAPEGVTITPDGVRVTIPGVGDILIPPGVTVTTSTGGPGDAPPGVTTGVTPPGSAPPPERSPLPDTVFDCSGAIFPDRDLSELKTGFEADAWRETALQILHLRYPDAEWIVRSLDDPGHFDVWFAGHGTGSWEAVLSGLSAAVHEDVHMVGFSGFQPGRYRYLLAEDLILRVPVVPTFDRSEIAADLAPGPAGMSYRSTYLEGESGAQGLETLLDEFNAYTWSLLVEIALLDQARNTTSARDGLLSMMYYTELYLHRARTEEPEVHRAILGAPELESAIVTLWDRAVCSLELSGQDRRLGIQDRELWPLVFDEELLKEIDELR